MPKRQDKYKPRADGRYHTQVSTGMHDENGRPIRIPLYAKSSKELEEKVAEAKYLLKTNQYVIEPEDITVYDYAEKWIRTYKSVKELNTNRMYMESLKYVVGPSIGEIKMSKLLSSDIQEMITEHKEHYRTCEIVRIFMHQLVQRAVKDGILHNDITLPPKPRTEKRALCFRVTWERIVKAMNISVSTKQDPNPVKGLTAHIFRHNYATMLYYSGINILKAADLMGHSDIKLIMDVYAHLDEEKEQAVDKINEVIKAVR